MDTAEELELTLRALYAIRDQLQAATRLVGGHTTEVRIALLVAETTAAMIAANRAIRGH